MRDWIYNILSWAAIIFVAWCVYDGLSHPIQVTVIVKSDTVKYEAGGKFTPVDSKRLKIWPDSMKKVIRKYRDAYNNQPCYHKYHMDESLMCAPRSCIDTSIAHWCREHNIKYEQYGNR